MDTGFFTYFLKHFPSLFYVFSCFLFLLCLCLKHNQSWWQSHITGVTGLSYSQLCAQSKNLLGAVCLLPRALVGRLYEEKKKHPGNPAEMALSVRGILLWRILYVSSKMCSTPAAERGGAVANVCTIFTCTCCTKSF